MKMSQRTYIRTFNSTAVSKIFVWNFLKKIVNFYCNLGSHDQNIFKNSDSVPINYSEQMINSEFFKISGK